ncbi:type IV pilus assembly protein PilM [Legionella septentrionalis]|uniref:Type IV pilus assembly protein PilM n=1 Tax=Legionella septentrionalis TaxID=2498109 RepID=A0A433JKQ2_9GAMM|nr:type IV pilus assembly protein PilM [Legionella septentrionalis]RUQ89453.1 type IV pilus assembly protein PilM [Legionella septentrionalis]RUQ95591.1 type IV pilus assembly protein PilM [Legionella septentrionalis]RUR10466.1 type IV pilus assembly protein PilM [Legionella septentrionalis]RUR16086.1 type IV pilus assembly protein PilM [Legionella septentrionalis]
MLKLFKPKHHRILGIDISSSSVKILEISANGDQFCVEAYGRIALPEGAMEGVNIKNVDVVAGSIKKLLTTEHFNCKQAALAVPDSTAISRMIQVNEGLRDEEIEELVTIEADKYIPYPIEEINLDFNILGPSTKNSAMLDVLIVASRAENVNNRVAAVTKAGLEAKIVDVESYVIERTARLFVPELPAGGSNKIVAIIDIGEVYTHFFILYGMKIIFSREEEFGGKQLMEAIVQRYGMKIEEARAAMEQDALPAEFKSEILQPFKESILLQVKRGLQFFFSTSRHTFVDYILLAGGIAKYSDIAQLLQEHINIPTSIANPFSRMNFSKNVSREKIEQDAPRLLVACGLALRA